jgi:hypothetical protein
LRFRRGLADNESVPDIAAIPAMFGSALTLVTASVGALKNWGERRGLNPIHPPYQRGWRYQTLPSPHQRGIQEFAFLNAPTSKRNIVVSDSGTNLCVVIRPSPAHRIIFCVCDPYNLFAFSQSRQNRMDKGSGILLRGPIESS